MALPAVKGVELQGSRSRRSWSGCTVIDVSINLCAGSINREGDFLGIEAGRQPWSYAPLPTLLLPLQETESSRKSHRVGPNLQTEVTCRQVFGSFLVTEQSEEPLAQVFTRIYI